MVTEAELLESVERSFALTARDLTGWPDPRAPADDELQRRPAREEEYSRVTDPGKWRIIGARVDAWLAALVETGLAEVSRQAAMPWADRQPRVDTADVAVPRASGALPLVVARGPIEDIDDALITLGAGVPTVELERFPDCGCDACDGGSQPELDELDRWVLSVVTGGFRRLWRAESKLTTLGDGSWATSWQMSPTTFEAVMADPLGEWAETFRRLSDGSNPSAVFREVDAIVADPRGWHEVTGTSWLDGGQPSASTRT